MATQKPNDGPDRRKPPEVYISPYEHWNFGEGRPYVFAAMRGNSPYISAFAEFAPPVSCPGHVGRPIVPRSRLPTLWSRIDRPKFLPFVVEKPSGFRLESPEALLEFLGGGIETLPDRLTSVSMLDIPKSRFRVALPVPRKAMHPELDAPIDPHCEPDDGLRARVNGRLPTIMAVIDDGIPFTHRNFREADGRCTRVEFCWLQSADALAHQTSVLFGREYTRAEINRDIEQFGDDEDRLYHVVGATSASEDFGSLLDHHTMHGAHVMNLAAGYDPARREEPSEDIRIIAVQLPNSVTIDTSGLGNDMYVLSAFHYSLNRADIIRKTYGVPDPRLVSNFSNGCTGGTSRR